MIKELGLVVTPGTKAEVEDIENAAPVDEFKAGKFRALPARASYLGLDRFDIVFAAEESCRHMTRPHNIERSKLRRIARHLKGRLRAVYRFSWQEIEDMTAYVDADFAGCLETRRSTSGDVHYLVDT